MDIYLQPRLENDNILLSPLEESDFDDLFQVAKDPEIWKNHPKNDRWERAVFKKYFDEAIRSKGTFKIIKKDSEEVVGGTRFYNYNEEESSIMVGYTFYAVKYWGKGINRQVKKMMLDYIFQFVSRVEFYSGVDNIRSQKALEKLGAKRVAKQEVTYVGEPSRINYLYRLEPIA